MDHVTFKYETAISAVPLTESKLGMSTGMSTFKIKSTSVHKIGLIEFIINHYEIKI